MDLPKGLSDSTKETVRRIADLLLRETGAAAVMLTGPHAMGVERATDKIYFIVITDDPEAVIEHRFVEEYGEIEKQMEIGIFPRKFVDMLVDRGYWDMVSYRAVEALRTAVPVIDEDGHGSRYVQEMTKHLPERRFVSGRIHRVVAAFDDAMSLYSRGDYEGAVLVVREALRLAVELVMKSSARSPEEPVGEVIERTLGEEAYKELLLALDLEGARRPDLERRLGETLRLSRKILEDAGIPDDFLKE